MQGPEESVEAICLLLHVCKGLPWGGNGSGVPEEGFVPGSLVTRADAEQSGSKMQQG